ncbi:hypothetical protein CK203_093166 [Vitis vinifera]|uniref:Uncharacterized protein n=1 Tax=Vitis vinifera TaxID=29760 RepID=A0A438D6H4_VITVI|nr:hypothetical protein CK203_093166 [Vitis vinifera]
MAAKNKKAKEETTRLKRELQDLRISYPSYDEEDEFSGGPAQGDGSAIGDRHALRGGPSIEDNFHGEWT